MSKYHSRILKTRVFFGVCVLLIPRWFNSGWKRLPSVIHIFLFFSPRCFWNACNAFGLCLLFLFFKIKKVLRCKIFAKIMWWRKSVKNMKDVLPVGDEAAVPTLEQSAAFVRFFLHWIGRQFLACHPRGTSSPDTEDLNGKSGENLFWYSFWARWFLPSKPCLWLNQYSEVGPIRPSFWVKSTHKLYQTDPEKVFAMQIIKLVFWRGCGQLPPAGNLGPPGPTPRGPPQSEVNAPRRRRKAKVQVLFWRRSRGTSSFFGRLGLRSENEHYSINQFEGFWLMLADMENNLVSVGRTGFLWRTEFLPPGTLWVRPKIAINIFGSPRDPGA